MIILECESAIIRNLLERSLDPSETLSETYQCCDFDGVNFSFKIERPKKKKGQPEEEGKVYPVHIEMNLPCWEAIKEYGAEERYNELYKDWIKEPSAGFTHALTIDLGAMNEAERKNAIQLAARLKANMLGAPFLWVAQKHEAKENFAPFEIPYRKTTGESMYLCPAEKGATVIFTIRFNDPGDHTIGNVFLNELQAARTRVPSAPAVITSPKAPKDLDTFDLPEDVRDGKMYAFVSISLLDPQLSARKREDTSYYIPLFRDYIHYHIKCTKAFLHQKMRLRAAHLLKILNEAKPEPKVKVQRTVTGKVIGKK
jgi:actin related protein 2/3 complex subunit 2